MPDLGTAMTASEPRWGLGGQVIPRVPVDPLTQAAKERVPFATREGEMHGRNLGVPDQHLAALDSDLDTLVGVAPGRPTPRKTFAHYYYPHPVTSRIGVDVKPTPDWYRQSSTSAFIA